MSEPWAVVIDGVLCGITCDLENARDFADYCLRQMSQGACAEVRKATSDEIIEASSWDDA